VSFLDDPGELREVPLAAVLLEALNGRATGVLRVDHDGGTSRIFLRDGVPVGAQSFGVFKPLGQALLAQGAIDVDALSRSLGEMAATGRPQGEVLVAMGAVTQAQVDAALAEQQAAYLTHIAGLAAGRFAFDAAAPVPPWTAGIRISPLQAIVDALEKPQATPLVVAALQPVVDGRIALAAGYRDLASAFGWSEAEASLVARLEGLTTLDAFFDEPGVAPERARAILAALLLLGLAAPRVTSGAAREAGEAVPGVVVDLADLAGVPVGPEVDAEPPAWPEAPPPDEARVELVIPGRAAPPAPAPPAASAPDAPAAPPAAPRPPLRRSDPDEARRRRQRLLQRAMQNMGIGPLSGQVPRGREHEAREGGARHAPTAAEAELRRALEAAAPRARSADLFERLGIPRGAGREQVKAAYFQLAKQLHPDRFSSPGLADVADAVKNLFAAVNEAYEVLSDDRKRADYLARSDGAEAATASPSGGSPAGAAVDFQKAEACARTRDWARARGFYEAALRADPRPEFQAGYAAALLADPRGDRLRAAGLVHAALRDPACDRAAVVGAQLARDSGDDEKAERLLRRALAANPRNAEADRELRALEARRKKPSGLAGLFRRR
jgi:curved DNA-binding protein CbpA